jgi:hypothetical protein
MPFPKALLVRVSMPCGNRLTLLHYCQTPSPEVSPARAISPLDMLTQQRDIVKRHVDYSITPHDYNPTQ